MSIKIAHEAPISILEKMQSMTSYDYALVHLFETHPEYYDYFYKARHDKHRDVLLDNSIFELGTAFDSEKFAEWVVKLQPSYYILPDVLEDGDSTIGNFISFSSMFKDLPSLKIGTVQGRTFSELVDCYRFMSEHADMIAISFDLSYYQVSSIGNNKLQRQCYGRYKFICDLIAADVWNSNKPHHLLGCSLAKEFSMYKKNSYLFDSIYSVDTSNPVVAGIKGLLYNGEFGLETKPSQKLFELIEHDVSPEEMKRIEYNVKCFERIVA